VYSTALILFQAVLHGWLMFGHRNTLGQAKGDRSFDRHYSRLRAGAAYASLVALHAFSALRGPQVPLIYALIGSAVFAFGFTLRLWSMRTLGHFFTFEIGVRQNHRLLKSGPYQLLRHPSYTGYGILLVGALISANAPALAWLGTLAPVCGFLWLRIRDEEKMLEENFGAEFRRHKKQTWRVFPWVY
jgi:protein-S-isoprenylcysteine O-methyltransferase Ste14